MSQLAHTLAQHLTHQLDGDALGSTVAVTRPSALRAPIVIGAAVLVGLQAGVYFAFSVGVMPGLRHVDDRAFVSTMQQINVSIVNPVFLLSFFGAPLLALAAIAVTSGPARHLAVGGAVLAVVTLLITIGGNIPLNDALANAGPVDRIKDLHAVRAHFENLWTGLNVVRTLTGTAALGLLVAALRG